MEQHQQLIDFLGQNLDANFIEPKLEKTENQIIALMNHSRDPLIRCLVRPMGELYAPIYWDSDLTVKLTYKKSWGGYHVFITLFNLAIFDLDMPLPPKESQYQGHLAFLTKILMASGLNRELFYVHATPRGYHLYLVSKTLDYCVRETFEMGQKLSCDPAHLRNTLYYGFSVRATLKKDDWFVSKKIGQVGQGSPDSRALNLYQKLTRMAGLFSNHGCDNILDNGYLLLLQARALMTNGYFGALHMMKVCPLWLEKSEDKDDAGTNATRVKVINLTNNYCDDDNLLWKRVCKYRYFNETKFLETIKVASQKIRNMIQYHILKSNNHYAIGYDLGHSLIFISYRSLLCIDYDDKSRLKIVYEFARLHPEYLFKVVKTNNGYHVFLISHLINHDNHDAPKLLMRLCSDPIHILNAYNRGFSIRINQKVEEKQPYQEVATIGRGLIDSKALKLYKLHFQLYEKYKNRFRCKEVDTFLKDILNSASLKINTRDQTNTI